MIFYPSVDKDIIENKIKDLHEYENSIKIKLGIENIEYPKTFKKVRDGEGFIKPFTKAQVIPNSDFKTINEIIICSESVADSINRRFGKIYDKNTFNKIVDIYLKFVLTHELVHVKQIKDGKITKENFYRNKELPYRESGFENEANNVARQLVSEEGSFEVDIVNAIYYEDDVDNEKAKLLISKFYENKNKIV